MAHNTKRAHCIHLVSVLSCFYQAQDRIELLALRSFVFVIGNITLPYVEVLMQRFDVDSYVNVCRTGLILLGEPELAALWVVIYILSVGYQVRGVKKPKPLHYNETSADDECHVVNKQQPVVSTCSDEAALLREALANKKMGFRDV
jgi:hypothetical protein